MNNKSLLSTLWIVLVVNFMFCDIFTLMHSEDLENLLKGSIDGVPISQGFLLTFCHCHGNSSRYDFTTFETQTKQDN